MSDDYSYPAQDYPYPAQDAVRAIAIAILLSIVTCGIYILYWQYKQIRILNAWLDRDEYSFVVWLLLSIVTCGIFGVYYEYKMARGINEVQQTNGFQVNKDLALICLLLAVCGLSLVSLAIQQAEINNFYGQNPDI